MEQGSPLSPSSAPSLTMLMADADRATAQAVKVYFERFGFRVDCAPDHATALQLLQAAGYDVVITDLNLSNDDRNDGLAVVSLARDLYPASRIIVLSGSGTSGIRARVHAYGADTFLHKPQHLAALRRTIGELRPRSGKECRHKQVAGYSTDTSTSLAVKAVVP
jgi:DNA-binding response OmpR family regulator